MCWLGCSWNGTIHPFMSSPCIQNRIIYASGRAVHHLVTSRVVYTSSLGPSHTNICIIYRKLSLKTITRKHPNIQCANCTFRIYALLFPSLRWTHGPKYWKLQNMFLSLTWTIMFLMTVVFYLLWRKLSRSDLGDKALFCYHCCLWVLHCPTLSCIPCRASYWVCNHMTFPWNMTYEMSHK